MKRGSASAARRYARALLDVALAEGSAEQIRGELRDGHRLLEENSDLLEVLTHPALGAEEKEKVVAAVWARVRASDLFLRLLRLLVERNRIQLLPSIHEAFVWLWNAHRGVVSAEAYSARPLSEEQRSALQAAIRSATGLEAELQTSVDPTLMGGLLLRMEGCTYDGSVRSQLSALRERLIRGGEGV